MQSARIVRHPPERRSRAVVFAGGCCTTCCCCCCLHTVGGLVGADIASAIARNAVTTDPEKEAVDRALRSYRLTVAIAAGIGAIFLHIYMLVLLPAVQLLAVFIAAVREGPTAGFGALGRVAAGIVLGTVAGGVAMLVLLVLLKGR